MADRNVVVLTNKRLFLASIMAMLGEQPGICVTGIDSMDDTVEQRVSKLRPDVIIFDSADKDFTGHQAFWPLIQMGANSLIIAVEGKKSEIQAFAQRRIVQAQPADLMELIESGVLPAAEGEAIGGVQGG